MSAATLGCILVSVCLSALAQIAFKFGVMSAKTAAKAASPAADGPAMGLVHALLSPGVIVGLGLYGLGTLIWLTALARVDVSQAYPFVGLGFALTAVLGMLVFGEAMAPQRVAGMLIVVLGIVVLARG